MESTELPNLPGPSGDIGKNGRGRPQKVRPPSIFCPGIQVLGVSKTHGPAETERFFELAGNQLGKPGNTSSATSRKEWDVSGKRVEVIRSQKCLNAVRDTDQITGLPLRQTLPDCDGTPCNECNDWSRNYFKNHLKKSENQEKNSENKVGERQERRKTLEAQKILAEEVEEFLSRFSISLILKVFIQCALLNSLRHRLHQVYPKEVIWLSTILSSYSSAGYRFISEIFSLPCLCTLHYHINKAELGCGFTPAGLTRIKNMMPDTNSVFGIGVVRKGV